MAWAFGQRVGSPLAKLVLLSLADHHNDETGADPRLSVIGWGSWHSSIGLL